MLSERQVNTLLLMRQWESGNLFANLPVELIKEISEYGQDPRGEFAAALVHVVSGNLIGARALLDANPRLVLCAGTTITRSGLLVRRKTLLEFAMGEGDPEMIKLILPYFLTFKETGGIAERDRQIDGYKLAIKNIPFQKPYDLTWLFAIIRKSSDEDVDAELIGNLKHGSELKKALIQFRKDVDPGIVTHRRMHYNYSTLIHAFELRDNEWDTFWIKDNKCNLVWRLVIGYLQRSMPIVDHLALLPKLPTPWMYGSSQLGILGAIYKGQWIMNGRDVGWGVCTSDDYRDYVKKKYQLLTACMNLNVDECIESMQIEQRDNSISLAM